MNSSDFIIKLNTILPSDFEAKKFEGMPRIHIKYNHYGFAVIDLKKDSYNLSVLEGMFTAVGIQGFERISNMRNKTNRIRSIPYENTAILQEVLKYVSNDPASIESKAVQSH
jgi:hypothetical protein